MGDRGNKKRAIPCFWGLLVTVLELYVSGMCVRAEGFYENPFLTFSPDHEAWTVQEALPRVEDAHNMSNPSCWYGLDESIVTGKESSLRELETGEHYYKYERSGLVPIKKWVMAHRTGRCIHRDAYPFHGISFTPYCCGCSYYSGWNGICADCGEPVMPFNVYMSKEKVGRLTMIDASLDYYYLCPTCGHMEQGRQVRHMCKSISANRYRVQYLPNGGNVAGFMQSSFHMYGNAEWYEGEPVTPVKTLSLHTYQKTGYLFAGWNTQADGTGMSFEDGQEIWNLTEENYDPGTDRGTIKLYAQWEKVTGILEIDPAGGSYQGNAGVTAVYVGYGEKYGLQETWLTPPGGHVVQFDTRGGVPLAAMRDQQRFRGWKLQVPAKGVLEESVYTFTGRNGDTDRVQALYQSEGICLPLPQRDGYSFGGWYYDPVCTRQAGKAGDPFMTQTDLTLYAQWVDLVLEAEENLHAHGGRGATDLNWRQPDNKQKTYLLYQRREDEAFHKILEAREELRDGSYRQLGEVYETEEILVERSGFYKLTANGAQGQGYGAFCGGLGGNAEGVFYLRAGDTLEIQIGKTAGRLAGNAVQYGAGGGRTAITSKALGVLLVAGGGGGAMEGENGGAGGAEDGLREDGDATGEGGVAGGGAGWIGGKAGIDERHVHTQECVHIHRGNEIEGGECYAQQEVPCTCHVSVYGPYRGNRSDNCDDCIRAGRNGFGSMHVICWEKRHSECGEEIDYGCSGWWECDVCGKIGYRWGSGTSRPSESEHTYRKKQYVLSCDKVYDCGDPPGRKIRSFGGSSYVNTERATTFLRTAGVNAGNGSATMELLNVGFLEETMAQGVFTPDLACPDRVNRESVQAEAAGENAVRIWFDRPQDCGTKYFHQVHSYLAGSDAELSASNITLTEIVTGISGYYYMVDERENTAIGLSNGWTAATFSAREEIIIPFQTGSRFFHVASMDRAGNLGETTTVELSGLFTQLAWKPSTEKMMIHSRIKDVEYGSVAKSDKGEDYYFVRADGRTPFLLDFSARLLGEARPDYQIDRMSYACCLANSLARGTYTAMIPIANLEVHELEYDGSALGRQTEGLGLLQAGMFGKAFRTEGMRRVKMEQSFCLDPDFDGKTLRVIPIAGAYLNGKVQTSDRTEDETNGIWLIGDGVAPQVCGLEEVERALSQRHEEDLTLRLSARDDGSGLAEFQVRVRNLDTGGDTLIYANDAGEIAIVMAVDDPLFVGDLQLIIKAVDRVGNVTSLQCGAEDLGLKAEIVRVLEPHAPVFKKGESGVLRITARGYVERIEVEFPAELTKQDEGINRTFVYVPALPIAKEEILFMVPLEEIEDREYEIKVTGYKGEEVLEVRPELCTLRVEDTVLKELRTRLR